MSDAIDILDGFLLDVDPCADDEICVSRHNCGCFYSGVRARSADSGGWLRCGFESWCKPFGEKAGVRMLVNTSCNGLQEPIVCGTPEAFRLFGTGIEILIVGKFVSTK